MKYNQLGRTGFHVSEVDKLDEVSELPAEYPGWMFARQGAHRTPKPFKKA
jgi:hypothetical protein